MLSLYRCVSSQEILRCWSLSIKNTKWVWLGAERTRLIWIASILSLCNRSSRAQWSTLLLLIVIKGSLLLEHRSSEVGTQVSFGFLDVISWAVSVSAVELVRGLELSSRLELSPLIPHLTLFLQFDRWLDCVLLKLVQRDYRRWQIFVLFSWNSRVISCLCRLRIICIQLRLVNTLVAIWTIRFFSDRCLHFILLLRRGHQMNVYVTDWTSDSDCRVWIHIVGLKSGLSFFQLISGRSISRWMHFIDDIGATIFVHVIVLGAEGRLQSFFLMRLCCVQLFVVLSRDRVAVIRAKFDDCALPIDRILRLKSIVFLSIVNTTTFLFGLGLVWFAIFIDRLLRDDLIETHWFGFRIEAQFGDHLFILGDRLHADLRPLQLYVCKAFMDIWLFRGAFEVTWFYMHVSFCGEIDLLADAFWRSKGRHICVFTWMVNWRSRGPWEDGSISDWAFGRSPSDCVSDHLLSCFRACLNLYFFSFSKRHDMLLGSCCIVQLSFSMQFDQDRVRTSEYFRGNALVIVGLDHFVRHLQDCHVLFFSVFLHFKRLSLLHFAVI